MSHEGFDMSVLTLPGAARGPRAARFTRASSRSSGNASVVVSQSASRSIADPDLIGEVRERAAALRSDRAALLEHYVRLGILTPDAKLTKRFGG